MAISRVMVVATIANNEMRMKTRKEAFSPDLTEGKATAPPTPKPYFKKSTPMKMGCFPMMSS